MVLISVCIEGYRKIEIGREKRKRKEARDIGDYRIGEVRRENKKLSENI